jgi:hypothetical protein
VRGVVQYLKTEPQPRGEEKKIKSTGFIDLATEIRAKAMV